MCAEAGTRYQRYSCTHGFGHAFMRIYDDSLRPRSGCAAQLGARGRRPTAPRAPTTTTGSRSIGADDASAAGASRDRSPRGSAAAQPVGFVRPCWYRAFVDNRPEGGRGRSAAATSTSSASGLAALQREACITAASVIGPPDPAAQLLICAGMSKPSDAESCVRGTKVQNLLEYPTSAHVDLIRRCAVFDRCAARGLLPLARQDTRRPDGRGVRPLGLPPARGRASASSCAEPGRGA